MSGRVTTAAGQPLADRPVRLASGRTAGDTALAFVTLGLSCVDGECREQVRAGSTDASGSYRIEVRGRDTQTSFGNVRPQLLSVSAAPQGREVSGASVAAEFVVQTTDVALPELRLVEAGLGVRPGPGRVEAAWSAAAGAPYALAFETGSVIPTWEVMTDQTSAVVDSRVLEDSRGQVVVSGGIREAIEGSDVQVRWRSAGIGYAAGAGTPLSRGLACDYGLPAPAQETERSAGCALTDGDLSTLQPPPGQCPAAAEGASPPPCSTSTAVTIRLPAAEAADLVVVRGCEGGCEVELSSDGREFRRVGSVTTGFGAVRVEQGPVQAVRVGLGSAGLREVSLWGPPAEPALQPLEPAAVEQLREPYAAEDDDARFTPALLIAVLVAGVTLFALGVHVGGARRRRAAGSVA